MRKETHVVRFTKVLENKTVMSVCAYVEGVERMWTLGTTAAAETTAARKVK